MTFATGRRRDGPSGAGVAAIVIHYGDAALTARAIRSISEGSTVPDSIIVIDNGPGALSAAIRDEAAGEVPLRVVPAGANLGFAGGVQLAMLQSESSRAAAVWLLNNDAVAERGALSALLKEARDAREHALVSSRILATDGRVWFEEARFYPWLGVARHVKAHPINGWLHRVAGRLRPTWLSVPYLPACSLLVPTEFTKVVGGFDRGFFLYGEDVDLSIRAARAGWNLVVATESLVVHAPSSGTKRDARERMQAATSLRLTARYFYPLVPIAIAGSAFVAVVRGIRARSLELTTARLRGLADELSLMFRRSVA